jgi:type I restriction enzyme S subunit
MKKVLLSDLINSLESGSRPKGGVSSTSGNIPSLGAEHLNDQGSFNFANLKFIPLNFYDNLTKGRIRLNDILIVKDGATTGKVSYVNECFPYSDAAINEHLFRVEINNKKADPSFIFRFLNSGSGQHQILKDFRGATVGGISRGFIEKVEIPYPNIAEQNRIAAILDKADAIRRKRHRAIQLADEFLRSVFFDMFGDPITNPKKWKKGHIQDLCEKIVDCPHSTPKYAAGQTDFACIRSSDIQNGYMDWSSTKYVDEAEYKKRIKRLEPGTNDVIYCREGARFGNAARIPKGKTICLGQRMMLFRSNHMIATAEFIWALLNSDSIYQQAVQKVGGSASPHINVADIKKFSIFFPPLSMQQNYSIVVKKIDVMKEKFQNFSLISDQIFNSITQHAFRGEL